MLLSVVLTGWYVSGMSRVVKYYTRWVQFFHVIIRCSSYLLQLPGHKGTVTAVDFHPKEPISEPSQYHRVISLSLIACVLVVLTGSKDGTMLLGELEPGQF